MLWCNFRVHFNSVLFKPQLGCQKCLIFLFSGTISCFLSSTHQTLKDKAFVLLIRKCDHFKPFSSIFHSVGRRGHNLLNLELIEHKTCTNLFRYLFQDFAIILYSSNVFFNLMAICENLNWISQGNYFIKSLFTEIQGCWTASRYYSSTSVTGDLILRQP